MTKRLHLTNICNISLEQPIHLFKSHHIWLIYRLYTWYYEKNLKAFSIISGHSLCHSLKLTYINIWKYIPWLVEVALINCCCKSVWYGAFWEQWLNTCILRGLTKLKFIIWDIFCNLILEQQKRFQNYILIYLKKSFSL